MQNVTQQDGQSADIISENIEKLKELFPDAFTEDGVNFDVLRQLLGDAEVLDEGEEKYGLNWHGKKASRQIALTPSTGTLRPCPDQSVEWKKTNNILVEGDNLEVLKILQRSYAGKVKMIYIDPPYNTGKEFIYPDKFKDNLGTYLAYTGQKNDQGVALSSNTETSGRFHTKWLNMMYPRMKVARNLLRDDGVLFVSIDEHEARNLIPILIEIFGESNFISQVCVHSNPRGRQSEAIATSHEYVLVFAKNADALTLFGQGLSEKQLTDYKHKDENGNVYRLRGLRHRGNESRRVDRPEMFFPLYVDPNTGG